MLKINKISKILSSVLLAGVLFTGCGQDDNADNKENASPSSKSKLGMIAHMNVNEKQYNGILKAIEEIAGVQLGHHVIFYDDLNSMQLGLQSKNIDEMSLYKCVGDYLKSKDSKIEILSESQLNFVDLFCCLVRAEDTELKQSIDAAIKSMKDDGTLDKLTKEYITDLKSDPPPVEISKIDGADTLKIAVTGDLPPLDLVLSDGKPAGFNTAVLSEISKRINQNIEIVQVNSAARAAALTSKEVDVVFWAIKPVGDKIPDDIDKPDGLELTVPYYQDDVVHIGLKK